MLEREVPLLVRYLADGLWHEAIPALENWQPPPTWNLALQRCHNLTRLSRRLNLLDATQIRTLLHRAHPDYATLGLEIFSQLDSTNQYLLTHPALATPTACLAEFQSAGRGRQGRHWLSPYAGGLCLSLTLPASPAFTGLPIALGVTTVETLQQLGVDGLCLKWPNDVWRNGCKLGGILVETRFQPKQAPIWVAGIGLNVNLSPSVSLPQDGVSSANLSDCAVDRNVLAGHLIVAWLNAAQCLATQGLAPFVHAWQTWDYLAGKMVQITQDKQNEVTALVLGIDAQGALRIQVGQQEKILHNATVRLLYPS